MINQTDFVSVNVIVLLCNVAHATAYLFKLHVYRMYQLSLYQCIMYGIKTNM